MNDSFDYKLDSATESILNSSPVCTYIYDVKTKKIVYSSPLLNDLLGYNFTEIMDVEEKSFLSQIHPDDVESYQKNYAVFNELKEKAFIDTQLRFKCADETYRWFSIKEKVYEYHLDSNILLVIGVFNDISEVKREEEYRRKNEERLSFLLNINGRAKTLTEYEIIELSMELATKLTSSTVGYLHEINPNQDTIKLTFWNKEAQKKCSADYNNHYPIEEAGVWADCARTKMPVIHNDYQNLAYKKGMPQGHFNLVRHLSVPVVDNGNVKMILGVGNKTELYNNDDVSQLQFIADEVNSIISKKRIEQELADREYWLQESQRVAEIGTYKFFIQEDKWECTRVLDLIFGIDEKYRKDFAGWTEILHPLDREMMLKYFSDEVITKRKPFNKDYRIIRYSDKAVRWVYGRGEITVDENNIVITMVGTIEDITERVIKAEELKSIIHTSTDGFWVTDINGFIIDCNDAYANMVGYTKEELLTKHVNDFEVLESREQTEKHIKQLLECGSLLFETKHKRKDGMIIDVEVSATYQKTIGDKIFVFVRDITEKKKTEDAILESEKLYNSLVETAHDLIWRCDNEGRFIFLNNSWNELLEYSIEEMLDKKFTDFQDPEYALKDSNFFNSLIDEYGFVYDYESCYITKNKSKIHLSFNSKTIKDTSGKVIGAQGTAQDITIRKKYEAQLIEKNKQLEAILKGITDGVSVFDSKGKLVYVNESVALLCGYSSSADMIKNYTPQFVLELFDFLDESGNKLSLEKLPLRQLMHGKRVNQSILCYKLKSTGEERWVEINSNSIYDEEGAIQFYVLIMHYITEKLNAEKAIRLSEERYHTLFDNSPIAIWEEDFSIVKKRFNYLKNNGVKDLRAYLKDNPSEVNLLISSIKIIGINKKSLEVLDAPDESSLLKSLGEYFTSKSVSVFIEEMAELFNGATSFNCQIPVLNYLKEEKIFSLSLNVQPGFESSLSRVLVSFIDITEQKKSELALSESEEKFRSLFNYLPVGSVMVDFSSKFISVNQSFCSFIGYSEQELIGKTIADITHPDDLHIGKEEMQKLKEGKEQTSVVEKRYIRKDGAVVWGAVSIRVLKDKNNTPLLFIPVIVDITQKKMAEFELINSENKYKSLFENANDAILVFEPDTEIILDANSKALEVYKFTKQEFIGKSLKSISKNVSAGEKQIQETLTQKNYNNFETTQYTKEGNELHLLISASVINYAGKTVILSINRDITEIKNTSEKIRLSEKKYRDLFDANIDGITIFYINPDETVSNFVEMNESAPKMLGYTKDDMINKHPHQFEKYITLDILEKRIEKIKAFGKVSFETVLMHKDGHDVPVDIKVIVIEYNNRPAIMNIVRDISERKQFEEELSQSEERFTSAFEYAPIGMAIISLEGKWLKVNQSVTNILGYTEEELITKTFQDITHPEDLELDLAYVKQMLDSEISTYSMEKRYFNKSGEIVWALLSVTLLRDSQSNPLYFISQIQDITERKYVEGILRESEMKYRQLFNETPIGIGVADMEGNIYDANLAMESITGYSFKNDTDVKVIDLYANQADRKTVIMELKNNGFLRDFEVELKKKGGEIFNALLNIDKIKYGNKDFILTNVRDITERKKAERALMEAEQRFRSYVDYAPDGIFLADSNGSYKMVNKAGHDLLGFEDGELLGRNISSLIHPKDFSRGMDHFKRLVELGNAVDDITLIRKDGLEVIITIDAVKLNEDNYLGFAKDITERKKAEKSLIESEERFRELVTSSPDSILVVQGNKYVYANPAAAKLLEYSIEEIIDNNPLFFFSQKNIAIAQEKIINIQSNHSNSPIEMEIVNKRGETKFTEVISVPIIYLGNRAVLILIKDITERKMFEEFLIEKEKRFRLIAENTQDVIWTMSLEGKNTFVSPSVLKVRGYTVEEALAQSLEESISPPHIDFMKERFQDSINLISKTGKHPNHIVEVQQPCKDGSHIWVEMKIGGMYDEEEKCIGIVGITRDISDRRNAEDAFKIISNRISTVIKNMNSSILMEDENRIILLANQKFCDLFNIPLTSEQIVGFDCVNSLEQSKNLLKEPSKFVERTNELIQQRKHCANEILNFVDGKVIERDYIPLFSGNKFTGHLWVYRNVTEKILADREIKSLQEKFSKAFYMSPDAVNINRLRDGLYLDINRGFTQIMGYTLQDVTGKTSKDINVWVNHAERSELVKELLEVGYITNFEAQFRKKDGSVTTGLMSASVIEVEGEKCILSITRDIADRKIVEAQLKESEERFKSLFNLTPDSILVHSDGKFILANPSALKLLRASSFEELSKISVTDVVHPDYRNLVEKRITDMSDKGIIANSIDEKFVRLDGTIVDVEVIGSPLQFSGKKAFQVVVRDITERKKNENLILMQRDLGLALLSSKSFEDAFRIIFDKVTQIDGIDSGGIYFVQNNNSFILGPSFGLSSKFLKAVSKIKQNSSKNIITDENKPTYMTRDEIRDKEKLSEGITSAVSIPFATNNRIIAILNLASHTLPSFTENLKRIIEALVFQVGAFINRIIAEEELKKSEEKFRRIVDTSQEGIWGMDGDEKTNFVNSQMAAMLGYTQSEMIGKKVTSFMFKEDLENHTSQMAERKKGFSSQYERRFRCKDGSEIWTLVSATSIMSKDGKFEGSIAMFADITLRMKTEIALRNSEEKYKRFFDVSLTGNFRAAEDGTLLDCNDAYLKIMEFDSKEEAFSCNLKSFYTNPEERTALYKKLKKEKTIEWIDLHLKTFKGNEVYLIESIVGEFDKNNKLVYATVFMMDVTKIRLSQKALHESEKRYRDLFNRMHDGFAFHEIILNRRGRPVDYRFLAVNHTFEKMTGLKAKDIVGKTVLDIMPGTEKIWIENYGKVALTGKPLKFENYAKEVGGYYKVHAYSPEKKKFACIIEDVTESKIQVEKIRQLSIAVEQSPVCVLITNLEGTITYVNTKVTQITKYTKNELIGKNPRIFKSSFTKEKEYKKLWNTITSGKNWSGIFLNKKKDGELYWESANISPLRNDKGKITHFVAVKEDITEKVHAEKELEMYRNHLEEIVEARTMDLDKANRKLTEEINKEKEYELMLKQSLEKEKELSELKTRFISTASHEFRTPLTSVLSSTELIERYSKRWTEEKFNEHINRIKNAVDYLTKLLDDVLTISRTDTGKIFFNPQPLNLREFCKAILLEVNAQSKADHKLIFKYLLKKKDFLMDQKLLKFMLTNLLSNAYKYSPKGGKIEFSISSVKDKICIKVSDEGIGIPDDDKNHLFEPFHRGLNTIEIHGTGLGMSIVKKAVDLHNGKIEFESELNKGTTFTISLPKNNG